MKSVPPGVLTVSVDRRPHPLAQLLAEPIDEPVVRAQPFAHDLRRDPDHVRVADAPPLDQPDDGHARRKLPFLRLHAQNAGVGLLERRRGPAAGARPHRPRRDRFDEHRVGVRLVLRQCRLETRRHGATRLVGDQRDPFTGLDRQTGPDGVARAGHQVGRRGAEKHRNIVQGHQSQVPNPKLQRTPNSPNAKGARSPTDEIVAGKLVGIWLGIVGSWCSGWSLGFGAWDLT